MNKRPLTNRERWLLALLPAGLIAIASFIVPMGATKRAKLEKQVKAAPSDEEVHRQMATLSRKRSELDKTLKVMEQTLAQTRAEIAEIRFPSGTTGDSAPPIAQRFKHLIDHLEQQQIALVATEVVQEATPGDTNARRVWALTLMGSWPQMESALSDVSLVPPGLWIDSLTMEAISQRTALRRWRMNVSAAAAPLKGGRS